jgi:DNA invertase Pin-like site-specific DNA recombinase
VQLTLRATDKWKQKMKIGYARVSTIEQNLDLQIRALKAAGAEKIFTDQGVSGASVIKPAYFEALAFARPGDEIMVWKLDRLSRSLRDLIDTVEQLKERDLVFRSLTEAIETETSTGKLFFHVIGAFAQFERDIIRDRTAEGIAAARASGKHMGRPPTIKDEQWSQIKNLMSASPPLSPATAAKLLGVSRQAVHQRLVKEAKEETKAPS